MLSFLSSYPHPLFFSLSVGETIREREREKDDVNNNSDEDNRNL